MARLKDRADVEFFALVGAIAHLVDQRLERVLPGELSLAGFGVLSHLAQWGGTPTPHELASAFHVARPTMTHTLQRLERQGFVTVSPDTADKRRKRVALTEAGVAAQKASMKAVRPQLESLRGAFAPDDFENAVPFLRALRDWLDSDREG